MIRLGMILALSFGLGMTTRIAKGDDAPTIPLPGEDRELTKGRTAEEFFRQRAADTACRADLNSVTNAYREAKKALADLVQAHADASAVDEQEAKVSEQHASYLIAMQNCGPCAARVVRKTVPSATHTAHWFVADGSCQLPADSVEKLQALYQSGKSLLLHLKSYPKHSGGFEDVLEFLPVANQTGQPMPDYDAVDRSPFFAFIAIRGPEFLKGFPTALSYYFRNEYSESTSPVTQFQLNFTATRPPAGFKAPKVYLVAASGRKTLARQMKLSSVLGSWYLNEKGYARYFTAADFPVDMSFAAKLAGDIMLNTLVQFADKIDPGLTEVK